MSVFAHAAGSYRRFRSRIDVWLGGALMLGIVVSGATAVDLVFQGGIAAAAFAIVPLLVTVFPIWLLIDTWYGVTDTDLIVHCGPFRTTVPISSIRSIRPTRTVLSAPALSLDRLEVTHAGGALVISPADKAGFVRALKERGPAVEETPIEAPSIISKQQRLLRWTIPLLPAVILLVVVGATVISGNHPLQVDVTSNAITVHGSFGTSVSLTNIVSVSLLNTLPQVRRTMGYGAWGKMRGRATSRELGERGHAYVTRNAPPFVVAKTTDGFLLFNTDDPARTRQLFEELQSKVVAIHPQPKNDDAAPR